MAKPIVRVKITGMPTVRRAMRGLSSAGAAGMGDMNKKAADIYMKAAKQEAPKHSHALADSGEVKKGRGHQYNATFGNSRVDYVPTVIGGGGRNAQNRPNKFGKRAMVKTHDARKKVYEDGIKKAIVVLGLSRRR